jgi:hypothetical protein
MGEKKRKAITPRKVKTFRECQYLPEIFRSPEIKAGIFADYTTLKLSIDGDQPLISTKKRAVFFDLPSWLS